MRRTKKDTTQGKKGHNTGQKGHLKDKTSSFRTKGLKGKLFGSVFFFPWARVESRMESTRA